MAEHNQIEEEFLSCYICFDVFKEPKTLACLHRFCERCLHNYIIGLTKTATNRHKGFPCPVCREVILAPDHKRPPSDWAALFRTDFHLKNLIKFVEYKAEILQGSKVSKIEHPCSTHADKDCDLYCADCCKPVCHLCAGIAHRGCNQVMTLTDAAEDRRARLEAALEDVLAKLDEDLTYDSLRENCLAQLHRQKCAVETEIKQWGQDLHQLVSKEENQLLQHLQEKYDVLQGKASTKLMLFEEKAAKGKNQVKNFLSKTKSSSDFDLLTNDTIFETTKKFREVDITNVKQYRTFLKSLSQVKLLFRKTNMSSISMGNVVFSYKPNNPENVNNSGKGCSEIATSITHKGVQRCTDDCDRSTSLQKVVQELPVFSSAAPATMTKPAVSLATFANYSARKGSISETGHNISGKIYVQASSQNSPVISKKKPVLLRTINTRFREDLQDPQLRDLIVVAPSNAIFVTDWANQCVKAFHIRREKDTRLTLGGKPWAITQLSDILAAVSLPLSKQICVLKTFPSLTLQNSFMSAKNYSGLASLNSTMLVASGGSHPPCVDIINLYGEVLKSFANDNSGVPLFTYPAYVSVTAGMLILVSDKRRGAVIAITHNGEVRFNFPPDDTRRLKEPSGVTSDPSGRVFAIESRGVLTISPDGQFERALVKPQDSILNDPRGVALDKEGLLYVTNNNYDIKVLKIT